jgi:predicted PolB exonuclease-like 3'-5' exonuclease
VKIVSIDIETVLDEDAADRCGYVQSDEFAPFPLHSIVCASALSVIGNAKGEHFYALESFSRGSMSERGILMAIEAAVDDANVVLTFNGHTFDLPLSRWRRTSYDPVIRGLCVRHDIQRRRAGSA